jgi:transposase
MSQRSDRVTYWAEIVRQYRQAGLSQAEFCRRNGVSRSALKNWLYKAPYRQAVEQELRPPTAPDAVPKPRRRTARFVPVALAGDSVSTDPVPRASEPTAALALEVRLGSGRAIAVAPGFDPETLRRLVALLEERP